MRLRFALLLAGSISLVAPAAASADFLHTVMPGESLTSVAAADGLTVSQLAAANGLSPTAQLTAGSGIQIPPQLAGGVASPTPSASGTAPGSSSAAAPSGSGSYVVQPGDTLSAIAARAGMSVDQLAAANGLSPLGTLLSGSVLSLSGGGGSAPAQSSSGTGDGDGDSDDPAPVSIGDGDNDSDDGGAASAAAGSPSVAAPSSSGSYVVQPGDTLSGIAARAGMSVAQLAAANGLNPIAPLLSGTALSLSGGVSTGSTSSSVGTSQPVGVAAQGSPTNPPYPTAQTVSPSEVGSIAAANGVSPSLAQAIAYQESGFNNGAVSSADARGVMQILPGTWNYIQQNLTPGASPLAPASATDNVRGGVELLHSLLNATGGNAALAAAGYYQGLPSVEAHGMYPDTQQYVNDVLSLQQRFNGG